MSRRFCNSSAMRCLVGCGLSALLCATVAAQADSLFPLKQANAAAHNSSSTAPSLLFSDNRAHNVGDPLLVVISENTSAASNAGTKTSHDDTVSFNGGAGLLQRLMKNLTFTSTNSMAGNGTGQTTRSGSLVTTLSVLVTAVLPNGALRIEGSRLVGVNKETQRVTFSGIVRPEDISVDNSISSSLVAGVEVLYDGKGVVGDQQKMGIVSRLFRFLF